MENIRTRKKRKLKITNELKEIIDGLLLGDGCIHPNGKGAMYCHSDTYPNYLSWLFNLLSKYGLEWNEKIYTSTTPDGSLVYRAYSFTYKELLYFRKRFYPNGKKIVPRDIELTPQTLFHWYIGDGSICKHECKIGEVAISTHGFNKSDIIFLVDKLHEIGIPSASIHKARCYFRITFSRAEDVIKFFDYIMKGCAEIPEDYRYKFPIDEIEKFRDEVTRCKCTNCHLFVKYSDLMNVKYHKNDKLGRKIAYGTCRKCNELKIEKINDELYEVHSGDNKYVVIINDDGETCTCKGFLYKKKCKHIEAVKKYLEG